MGQSIISSTKSRYQKAQHPMIYKLNPLSAMRSISTTRIQSFQFQSMLYQRHTLTLWIRLLLWQGIVSMIRGLVTLMLLRQITCLTTKIIWIRTLPSVWMMNHPIRVRSDMKKSNKKLINSTINIRETKITIKKQTKLNTRIHKLGENNTTNILHETTIRPINKDHLKIVDKLLWIDFA